MKYSKEELINYRVERAQEALNDAVLLVDKERWNAAANRMYYACFYIVSAYLAFKDIKATTHSGLKTAFNQELVKTGRIEKSDGITFNKLFSIRQQADYDDFVDMSPDEIIPLLPKIDTLIQEIKELITGKRQLD